MPSHHKPRAAAPITDTKAKPRDIRRVVDDDDNFGTAF
jgi:hypothetical protein